MTTIESTQIAISSSDACPVLAIYYHSPCSDGHAAAWAIKSHLGSLPKYFADGAYNIMYIPSAPGCQQIDLALFAPPGCEAWFLDLMPSYDMLKELCDRCTRVVVLDHHKTNLDICGRIHMDDFAMGGWAANLEMVFDMKRAGCQIAWDWITVQLPDSSVPFILNYKPTLVGSNSSETLGPMHSKTHTEGWAYNRVSTVDGTPLTRPWFLEYIADRDLWTWRLPNSKLINTALFGLKLTITPDAIAQKLALIQTQEEQERYIAQELMPYALAAEEFNNELLRTACNKADECALTVPSTGQTYRIWLGTTIGSLRSDLGNQLCNKPLSDGSLPDLSASWHYEFPKDEWWISLRSLDTGADVSAIAKEFGGGGHMCAAGFTLRAPDNLNTIFRRISTVDTLL